MSMPPTDPAVTQAMESVYASLHNDNEDLDIHIAALKAALKASGVKSATVDPGRLVQNNRQGRKMMLSYFRQRGVEIVFLEK